jgi:hypothetical protein
MKHASLAASDLRLLVALDETFFQLWVSVSASGPHRIPFPIKPAVWGG